MPNHLTLDIILQTAVEIPDLQERADYLDGACGGDQALREEVTTLIEAHLSSGTFMDADSDSLWREVTSEKENDMIGRYRLIRKIGEGGFGTVYLAEQSVPVKRQVALKLIKPGMDTKEIIARFEGERQALALMDHPHIAKVHDAGTTDGGRPYFVMELVKGVPITNYCAESNLDTWERLDLFISLCAAVQHAHQKGIIHRDLKPTNILVSTHDGKPVVKVIDFGIAKAIGMELTEKTIFTQFGLMIGTPQYMSPEQAELHAQDVDTRSDIYSLGVILYELLTGTTPLAGERLRSAAYSEIQRMIREETPPRPSNKLAESLSQPGSSDLSKPGISPRALRGDLDWIVLKALEKDPSRRYESAGALAEDLGRFLQHKPVKARPPSMTYAMLRFARRYRGPVFAGSGLLLALVLGAVGTTIGMKRALDAKEELVRKNVELDRQKLALVDYKERLAVQLESNQRMLGDISSMGTSPANLPKDFEALQKQNQTLLDRVRTEVADQKRYAEEIKKLEFINAQLQELAGNRGKENADLLSKLTRRPAGKYTGSVTIYFPEAGIEGLKSTRTLDFGSNGKKLILTSVGNYLDNAGIETRVAKRSVVELIGGSWDSSLFRNSEQRVISTDLVTWAQEDMWLNYSMVNDQIEMILFFKRSGKVVFGKGMLTPTQE